MERTRLGNRLQARALKVLGSLTAGPEVDDLPAEQTPVPAPALSPETPDTPFSPGELTITETLAIGADIQWLEHAIEFRMADYTRTGSDAALPTAPPLPAGPDAWADLVRDLADEERLILILATAPHLAPEALDIFLVKNTSLDRRFSELGGVIGRAHAGLLPTAETARFLLAGDDIGRRIAFQKHLSPSAPLLQREMIRLDHQAPEEPALSALLLATETTLNAAFSPPPAT